MGSTSNPRTSNPLTPELFEFLRDLRGNNSRDWFQAQKSRYEDVVKEAALTFISDFGPHLEAISPHLAADPRPVGGSMFRIYRDTRFSHDKSPYKTHVGIQFRHKAGKDVHAPCFYLHLEPGSVFAGAGIWHPDAAALKKVRDALVEKPARWRKVMADPAFNERFELDGDVLKRPPRGYAADHPLIEDLKRKDFIGVAQLGEEEATSDAFLTAYAETCRRAVPLMRFLCEAVGVPF